MAQLAQAYVHLKPYGVTDRKARSLGTYAEGVALRAAREIYGGDIVVETELEEGSLILRVTVVGGLLLGTYSAISDYKGFKESIAEICKDAREFGVDVCYPFVKKAGVPKDDVYRFERRLKTPGKIYRVAKRLERLEGAVGELSRRDIETELANARAELNEAFEDLSANERAAVERRISPKNLPPPKEWPEPVAPARIPVANSRDDDPLLFDEELPDDDSPPKRRVLFKSKKKPSGKGRGRSRRRRQSEQADLDLETGGT